MESCVVLGSREIIYLFASKGLEEVKGRLSHPGWEVKKPEIGDGATEGGREEVDAFSRYFISHLGHQVSCISGDTGKTSKS